MSVLSSQTPAGSDSASPRFSNRAFTSAWAATRSMPGSTGTTPSGRRRQSERSADASEGARRGFRERERRDRAAAVVTLQTLGDAVLPEETDDDRLVQVGGGGRGIRDRVRNVVVLAAERRDVVDEQRVDTGIVRARHRSRARSGSPTRSRPGRPGCSRRHPDAETREVAAASPRSARALRVPRPRTRRR